MNRIEEVIIHFGMAKTATSSIQETLFNQHNSCIWHEYGFLYPQTLPPNHFSLYGMFFSECKKTWAGEIVNGLSEEQIEPYYSNYISRLQTEINESSAQKLVISAEALSYLDKFGILRLLDELKRIIGINVKFTIPLYVRHRLGYETSRIQQMIKYDGLQLSQCIEMRLNEKKLYSSTIEKLLELNDAKIVELKLYKFEEALEHKYGPVGHFLDQVMHIPAERLEKVKYNRANDGMSKLAIEAISRINGKYSLMENNQLSQFRSIGDTEVFKFVKGPAFELTYDEECLLFENSLEDIEWLLDNTGIDYRGCKPKEKIMRDIELDFDRLNEFMEVLSGLNEELRIGLIDYIENTLDKNGKNIKYLNQLKSKHKRLLQEEIIENRLIRALKIDKTLDRYIIYKILEEFFSSIGDTKMANIVYKKSIKCVPSVHRIPYINVINERNEKLGLTVQSASRLEYTRYVNEIGRLKLPYPVLKKNVVFQKLYRLLFLR